MKPVTEQKVKRLEDLARRIQKLKASGKKIVHCHGVFDLIHPGHIRHFSQAKKYGDILVVTITADKFVNKGPGRPVFKQELRAEVLSSIAFIDYVAVVNSAAAIQAIAKIKPDFYIKGPDYIKRKVNPNIPQKLKSEEEEVSKWGGKLVFTEDIIFSSSALINENLEVYPPITKSYLDFLKSKYSADYIIGKLTELKDLKILIIGDAIIDEYHYCLPSGKSSKEPVMVHQYISDETFIGGTLATANHLSSLSEHVTLVSLLGKKRTYERFIKSKLRPQITPQFFYQNNISTIVKRRFLDLNTKQKLFQLAFIKENFLTDKTERKILRYLSENLSKFDLVVVNDFGHGFLTKKIISAIARGAKFLCLNVQANSANYGFNVITKYPRADFICIDTQEIRLATHDQFGDLPPMIKKIQKQMKCSMLIVTKGYEGSIAYQKQKGFHEMPSLTSKVVDRVGAGDALFAVSSPCVFADFEMELTSFVGNVAGAMQVQVVGNSRQIDFETMVKFITRLLK